ncbi:MULTISPECIES: 2'-5' RNA ligase family protein [Rhizobium]|uniref:2'-5' RNA ligase n=1 Tax=Rhizobium paranaense TaxID=1650438 RepID=A0A7W8XLG2_9HYPH|nr:MULTISPECIES: 2'-5' RNA ligase family protein [Rhizobium]MBB5571585.1 2'-5' RNA ligase [Rhizobium paranaense]PST64117.1 calmodulin [Rhizobium sp. SEMIA4064]
MPYAISLKCTNNTALPVFDLWRQAGAFETVPSMQGLSYPPHLTFVIYEDILPEHLCEAVAKAFHNIPAISVEFSGIRHFRNDVLVLWASPVDDSALRHAHHAIHQEIDPTLCDEHYRPDHWQPHCTIAMKIPMASAETALTWAAETPARFTVTFDAVDCVRFPPVEILSEIKLAPRYAANHR